MRVGLDQFTLHPYRNNDPFFAMDWVQEHQLDGVQFGGVRGMSPGLDRGKLREIEGECRRRGLYCLVSVQSPNPLTGQGGRDVDAVVGDLTAEIEAAAELGWRELHSALGGLDERLGKVRPWTEHMAAGLAVLRRLAPVLKAQGCRINLETHGDATTFDLVRLCEAVGPQVLGICLDTANVMCHCEDPLAAARRAAPYVHQTHIKDGIIYLTAGGYSRQGRAPGEGVVPWEEVLAVLGEHAPDLCLSIEDHKWVWEFPIYDPAWLKLHPDITAAEMGQVVKLAWQVSQRIAAGEIPQPEEYEKVPYIEEVSPRIRRGSAHLRMVLGKLGLAETRPVGAR